MTARRRLAAGATAFAAFACSLLLAGSVVAQTPSPAVGEPPAVTQSPPPAPSPEALHLATIIADGYVDSALADAPEQFDELLNLPIFKSAALHKAPFNNPVLMERYPGWIAAARHALIATMTDCSPRMKALLAQALAERFSIEALRAGAQFMSGPGGRYAGRVYMHERPTPTLAQMDSTLPPHTLKGSLRKSTIETLDAVNAKAHAPLPPEAQAALAQLKQTEGGREFIKDVLDAGVLLKDYKADYIEMVMGPMFLHLSEDFAADQARRDAAAPDAPTPEALALGKSIVHGASAGMDDHAWTVFTNLATNAAAKAPVEKLGGVSLPPDYTKVMLTTFFATLRDDQPAMETAVGRAMARTFAVEDLRALSELANGPAPAYFVSLAMAKLAEASGQTAASPHPLPPDVQASLEAFTKSGAPQRMGARLQDKSAKEKNIAIAIDTAIPIATQWMHRMGVEYERLYAERQASHGR